MSIDVLQERIRKLKNPSVIDFGVTPEHLPQHLLDEEGSVLAAYCRFCRELMDGMKHLVPAVRFSFATFALMSPDGMGYLSNLLEDNFDGSTFVFVSGGLNDRLVTSLTALELPNGVRQEVYTFEPYEQIAESARPAYLDAVDAHREELLRYGITVHDLRETVLSREEVTVDEEV